MLNCWGVKFRDLSSIPDDIEPSTQVLDVRGNDLQVLRDDSFIQVSNKIRKFSFLSKTNKRDKHSFKKVISCSLLLLLLLMMMMVLLLMLLLLKETCWYLHSSQLSSGACPILKCHIISARNHQPSENLRPILQNPAGPAKGFQKADKSGRTRSWRESAAGDLEQQLGN